MLKKFLFTVTVISVFFMTLNAFAFAHKLRSNWYDENIAGTKKENVTSITFENETFNTEHARRIYWKLDNDGLVAYMDSDTDVVIAIPEGNTLETSFNSQGLFSFYKEYEEDKENYETGDNGRKIYGVKPDDGSYPVDDYSKYESDLEYINNLYLLNTYPTENFDGFFMGLKNLISVDVSNMNTPFAKSFARMFMGCEKLESIDISNFNTENVVDMSNMFRDCKKLTNINLGNLKTNKLEDMSGMFENCESLKTINLNGFTTSKVTNMSYLFKNCLNLESVFLDKINTKEVRNMSSMFDNCKKLKLLDISHFNTKSLNNCSGMFIDCASLYAVDLSRFNLTGNVNVENMLIGCDSLGAILISDSICKRFNTMRLDGKWQNIHTKKIYNFDNENFGELTAGGYIKIK